MIYYPLIMAKNKSGYRDCYCPSCGHETYFDGNTCQCCHQTFTDFELTNKVESMQRIGKREFLCDSCLFDWRTSCTKAGRPNIRYCTDYKPR
jgi:hypothetical protein